MGSAESPKRLAPGAAQNKAGSPREPESITFNLMRSNILIHFLQKSFNKIEYSLDTLNHLIVVTHFEIPDIIKIIRRSCLFSPANAQIQFEIVQLNESSNEIF